MTDSSWNPWEIGSLLRYKEESSVLKAFRIKWARDIYRSQLFDAYGYPRGLADCPPVEIIDAVEEAVRNWK